MNYEHYFTAFGETYRLFTLNGPDPVTCAEEIERTLGGVPKDVWTDEQAREAQNIATSHGCKIA